MILNWWKLFKEVEFEFEILLQSAITVLYYCKYTTLSTEQLCKAQNNITLSTLRTGIVFPLHVSEFNTFVFYFFWRRSWPINSINHFIFCSFQKCWENVDTNAQSVKLAPKIYYYFTNIRRQMVKSCVTFHLIASFIFKDLTSHFKSCKVFELFMQIVNGGAWMVLCNILL